MSQKYVFPHNQKRGIFPLIHFMKVRLGALAATLAADPKGESADFLLVAEILESQGILSAEDLAWWAVATRCPVTWATSFHMANMFQVARFWIGAISALEQGKIQTIPWNSQGHTAEGHEPTYPPTMQLLETIHPQGLQQMCAPTSS